MIVFPLDIWLTYTAACLLLVISPGPDNLLAIARGLSQGRMAASVSGIASGTGILFHTTTASLGLTLLMQTSALAFWVVKVIGASYLLWLGIKVLRSRSLINFQPTARQPLIKIFLTGFLSAALNPKPGLFVLAFIPQFVNPKLGSVSVQMMVYGAWFAALTALGFALMGIFATSLSAWLQHRPKVVNGLNLGAGFTFVVSGLSIAALSQK
jgi:threonine/homoserine/homoserine lactone efflux protein